LSGRRDLNPGLLAPKASALAGLRYAPNTLQIAILFAFVCARQVFLKRRKSIIDLFNLVKEPDCYYSTVSTHKPLR
jgi:hypothetical protein